MNETGSAGEAFLQVDEYASVIIPLKETCPWLVDGSQAVAAFQEKWGSPEVRVTEDTGIYNDPPEMRGVDNWYWRDKPLHKNTIK